MTQPHILAYLCTMVLHRKLKQIKIEISVYAGHKLIVHKIRKRQPQCLQSYLNLLYKPISNHVTTGMKSLCLKMTFKLIADKLFRRHLWCLIHYLIVLCTLNFSSVSVLNFMFCVHWDKTCLF